MLTSIRHLIADESGATAVEYGLIAALVALVLVIALSNMGNALADKFNQVADRLSIIG